jgi:penicillin-binding protein-related factor A (putative recombinase)
MCYLEKLPNSMFWRNNTVGVYDPKTKRYRRPGRFALRGVPDILGIYRGVATAFEIKTPKRRNSKDESSEAQREFLRRFNSLGGFGRVLCSVDEAIQAIGELNERFRVDANQGIEWATGTALTSLACLENEKTGSLRCPSCHGVFGVQNKD